MKQREVSLEKIHYKFPDEDSDVVHSFIEDNKTIPSYHKACGPFLYEEVVSVFKEVFKTGLTLVWDYEDEYYRNSVYKTEFNGSTVFLKTQKSFIAPDNIYLIPNKKNKFKHKKYGWIITASIDILYDISVGKPQELIDRLSKIELDMNDENNAISLICQDPDGSLFTKEFPLLKTDFSFDLDLHYGEDFTKFHEITVKRIDESEKGIILFHGVPGSGKSFYIRRLVRDLMVKNKAILYMPNNMVDMLGTPSFNNFLLDFADGTDVRKGILIIIEDAEKVLLKRETNPYGSSGVSNILNSTDGILNDFLSIQVLATFNCNLEDIDPAILRKKRAISIREFKKLSEKDAQKLVDHLEIKYTVTEEMTLADVYSIEQEMENEILVGKKKTPKKIGFNQQA